MHKIFYLLIVFSLNSYAVTIGTAKKVPDGLYVIDYLSYYSADILTDENGDTKLNNFDLDYYQNILAPVYYKNNFVYFLQIPMIYKKIGLLNYDNKSLGDVSLLVGYFLPIKGMSIAPAIQIDFPTGDFDKNASTNNGAGVYGISSQLYFNKSFNNFMLDAVVKYKYAFKNNDTGKKKGNEFRIESVLAYKYSKRLMFGPSFTYIQSDSTTINEIEVDKSDTQSMKLGFDIKYPLTKRIGLLLNYTKDISSKNTTKGTAYTLRLTFIPPF